IGEQLPRPSRNKNNSVRTPPHRCERVCSTAPHVQRRRRGPKGGIGRAPREVEAVVNARHRQYATPRPHRVIKAAPLHKIGHCYAIDPKSDSHISAKARVSRNNETPAGLSGSGSNRNRVNENRNQEEPTRGSVF